jgi:hypothetical protein
MEVYTLNDRIVYLKNKEGEIVVMALLREESVEKYKNNEPLTIEDFCCFGDYRRILEADFS